MKKVKIIFGIFATLFILLFILCGLDSIIGFIKIDPSKEELLMHIPEIDIGKFNRFLFKMDIIAGDTSGDSEEITVSGVAEICGNVSHMYNLDIDFKEDGKEYTAETWTDLGTGERYTDLGEGFAIDSIMNFNTISDLENAINNRGTEMLVTTNDSACTLSWTFPTDNEYLFGELLEPYVNSMDLVGDGRIAAVLDPETFEFQYFTIVISAGNSENVGAIIDSVFYWDEKNTDDTIQIPVEVSNSAYESSTGVSNDGGYDEIINPLAEDFVATYGGTVEVSHYDDGAAMFWTYENDGESVTVNYIRTNGAKHVYNENYEFMMSFYGDCAETTDNGAYFYSEESGELTLITQDNGNYIEIIITDKPGTTQGTLRKSLITYKSKLGI